VTSPVVDDERLRMLYDAHAGQVLAYALRLTNGDRGRAEDIVQETLIRAWRTPQMDASTSPRAWLLTVAHRIAIDAHRARVARPAEVGESRAPSIAAADELDARLDRMLVLDALATLTAEHRAAVVETHFHGRSVTEAARVLGIPAGTVKSRCYYGLRALRLALVERGVVDELR
jgi:RNA polymerase sigma-70 factor (ECF subfamily)